MNSLRPINLPRQLGRYAEVEALGDSERQFKLVTAVMLAVCVATGTLLSLAVVPEAPPQLRTPGHNITFEMRAVSLPVPKAPEPIPEPVRPEPPRLDPKSVLGQVVDRVPLPPVPSETPATATTAPEPAPRRVYGVRKVYARGLGTGGGAGNGLVVKQGNTVDGRPDTLTATEADLRGELAALSTVDRAPEPIHRVKPDYSPALKTAHARGTVTAYLLVDVDGSVQDVKVTEDVGYDSREVATTAFRQFRFHPALRDGKPVAVWILHRIRFEFQE